MRSEIYTCASPFKFRQPRLVPATFHSLLKSQQSEAEDSGDITSIHVARIGAQGPGSWMLHPGGWEGSKNFIFEAVCKASLMLAYDHLERAQTVCVSDALCFPGVVQLSRCFQPRDLEIVDDQAGSLVHAKPNSDYKSTFKVTRAYHVYYYNLSARLSYIEIHTLVQVHHCDQKGASNSRVRIKSVKLKAWPLHICPQQAKI